MAAFPRPGVGGASFPLPSWVAPGASASSAPPASGGQPAGRRTFASAISPRFSGGNAFVSPIPLSFANLEGGSLDNGEPVGIKAPVVVNGCPSFRFSKEEMKLLSKPLELSLVGKFGMGRPKWDALVRFFRNLHLFGSVNLASLDARHCLITLSNLDDYTRLFSNGSYLVSNYSMKIIKWTKEFKPNAEPSLVPAWITLPGIGAQMFTQNMLFSIASAFGKPLKVAYPTAKGLRGDNARILVEVDLLVSHPTHVTLEDDEDIIQQLVVMDPLPKYCTGCKRIGHDNSSCYILHPNLKKEYIAAKEAMKAMRISKGMGSTDTMPEMSKTGGEAPILQSSGSHAAVNTGRLDVEEGEVVIAEVAQQSTGIRDLGVCQDPSVKASFSEPPAVEGNNHGGHNPHVEGTIPIVFSEEDLVATKNLVQGGQPSSNSKAKGESVKRKEVNWEEVPDNENVPSWEIENSGQAAVVSPELEDDFFQGMGGMGLNWGVTFANALLRSKCAPKHEDVPTISAWKSPEADCVVATPTPVGRSSVGDKGKSEGSSKKAMARKRKRKKTSKKLSNSRMTRSVSKGFSNPSFSSL